MKILTVIVILLVLKSFKCNVTNRVKDFETTTRFSTNENSAPVDRKEVTERTHKVVKDNKEYVYLENVLFALKHQNWTEEEEPCLNQTLRLIHSLQNFTLWAVWDWDSIASEPLGLLYGNRYQLGNFDECLQPTWAESNPELKTQYCLSEIVLERTDHPVRKRNKSFEKNPEPYASAIDHLMHQVSHSRPINELTWGVCVPAVCSPLSVERLLSTMLSRSHLAAAGMRPRISVNEKCQTAEPMEYDGLFYAFMIMSATLTVICLVCTYINCRNQKSNQETNAIIKAFCVKENGENLLKVNKEGGAEVLYGVRFLTICLIVLDHLVGIQYGGPISNGLYVDGEINSFKAMLLLHDDLFVDTFFFLSGFLLATAVAKSLPNLFIMFLKRYVRLIVAFALVIFYICAVFPYTGSGPLWNRAIEADTGKCKKTWWISLLMLNNYIDTENICLIVSWYIASDFHFFIVTLLIYWIYKHYPKIGITLGVTLFTASMAATSVINYMNNLSPVQLFTYQFVTDIRGNEQFNLTYIKSHTRYPPYLIGFLCGFAFVRLKNSAKRISQPWSIVGCVSGLLVMFCVMADGVSFLWRAYAPAEGALYAAFNRPVWTCGLALVFFCLAFGTVPLVEGFLSWYPWVPLSRLAYGLYLTHTLFITRHIYTTRNSVYHDDLNVVTVGTGVIFWGCASALALWLLAEAPANNLLRFFFAKLKETPKREENENGTQNTSATTISNSSGNLRDNLPTVVCFSKM
ncbi:nose resistant to fluoxetine protein 6-like [Plodia interpunctella]|uniref:nose resistant to fluoxetine protein 6-like n=1 Tax=Plodia interpunctella TaxID=58824 RepID=UPI0023683853|nr:nose resistant to fluoxetine protein 6-like [Plodia interpunctella]